MANSVSEGPNKESWKGVALAEAAEKDEVAMLREDGDGASTSLSSSSSEEEEKESAEADSFTKSRGDWQKDEKLLEELFRLKLSSSAAAVPSSTSLPPKQRIKLYQPRTKLEQFEDILIESQLLEASLPDFEVAALAEAAGLSAADLDLDLMNGFDFEASDVIFSDVVASEFKDNDSTQEKTLQGTSCYGH